MSIDTGVDTGADVTTDTVVRLRPAGPADEPFLLALHLESHPEFALLPSPVRSDLVALQITAQRRQYEAEHPQARDEIVEVDGVPVGRCWTSVSDTALHILDVAVVAAARNRCTGRRVLDEVMDRADLRGVPVRLMMWHANRDAQRLYARAGFTAGTENGGYVPMTRWTESEGAR